MTKGKKRQRGEPVLHNETKKQVNMTLTPTAIKQLDALAGQYGISRSELVERMARGEIRSDTQTGTSDQKLTGMGDNLNSFAEERYSVEISAHLQTVPLRCRERIPSCQGAYAVFALGWEGAVHSSISNDIKADLEADLHAKPEFQELLGLEDVYAWIVWGKCSDKLLLANMQERVIKHCEDWLTDPLCLQIYDDEYDCETGWCGERADMTGPLATKGVPRSLFKDY